jgi:hypothetical protein
MSKFFNTAGPVNDKDHYCLPPLTRFDLVNLESLITQKKYFVLHAPRQTGKTSSMLALMKYLNEQGQYRALYVNVEAAQAAREQVGYAMQAMLSQLASMALIYLNDDFIKTHWAAVLADVGPFNALNEMLARWAQHSPKPVILFIDEIDALVGDTLISVLRQLRTGYAQRPANFPQSIILCGIRDVRDYRIHSSAEKAIITGGSAFNIKAKSLRLGNFTAEDIVTLYHEHTAETGQIFAEGVLPWVWELTGGQPWLVNALAYEVCFEMKAGRDRTQPITVEMINEAKEQLILRRETHLDQLVDKLKEPRVQRVIEPILAGEDSSTSIPNDDIMYVRDLGLISMEGQLRIANRIYQEVIPRELTYSEQVTMSQESAWYVTVAGELDMTKLLAAFQQFFRQHSEHWLQQFDYKEAGPQLLLQAFLQRIVNGGGRVEREYGLGHKRTDLLVIWPRQSTTPYSNSQLIVIELKILYGSLETTITEGLKQTWEYMDKGGAKEGHLVIFDRTPDKAWAEKLFKRKRSYKKQSIQVWGM